VPADPRPWQQISPEVTVKGFKNSYISDEMDGGEEVEDVGDVGS
jgi:hypothetical protein